MVGRMNRQQRRQAARTAKQQGKSPAAADPRLDAARKAHSEGRLKEAETIYDQLLAEDPKNADAVHFKGLLFYQHGRNQEAILILREAIKLRRGVASFHGNLANVLFHVGDMEAAETEYRKAIRLDRKYAKAYNNFSALLMGQGRFSEAEATVRSAIKLEPENFESFNSLASILRRQGHLQEAEDAFRRAVELNPDYEEAHGNLIFLRDFNTNLTFADQQMDRRLWAERFIDPLMGTPAPHENLKEPDRKLRIGYVSGDFRNHSAAITFGAAIFERDRMNFEAFCYTTSARRDSITEKFEAAADAWRPVWGMPDSDLVEKIREDKIDILVDLAGHSAGNRLPMFGYKPAPIQITAWGHCTGTGMKAMDYILADAILMPPEDAHHCAEEVIELSCGLNFAPPEDAPNVASTPMLANGYPTFGCFNRIEKLVDETFEVWAQILNQTPDARLVLKNAAFDNPAVVSNVNERMGACGIELERVDLIGKTSWYEHMAAFSRIDIALDPFPNNGGVTTLETLWMGVPLVAMRGPTAPSRLGASMNIACGHADWVGETIEDYIEIAGRMARNPDGLEAARMGLRSDLETRPLGNPPLYAREVEAHYRRVWQTWCAQS